LKARKRAGKELGEEPGLMIFDRFLQQKISRLESLSEPEEAEVDPELLNQLFREVLRRLA